MSVYLWQADGPEQGARGVTDDERSARRAAADLLRCGQASTAVVEQGGTGRRWQARVGAQGRIRWDPAPEMAGFLTPSAVAALFRVSSRTPRRWADAGKLTEYRTRGGHRRFSAAEVGALLRAPAKAGRGAR